MSAAAVIQKSRSTWSRQEGLRAKDLGSGQWALELRRQLRVDHDRIDATELARSILEARITRPQYIRYLQQLLHIHEALEAALEEQPALKRVGRPEQRRSAVLRRDLAALGASDQAPPLPATTKALALIKGLQRRRPIAILGILYVREAARLSSVLLYQKLSRALDIPAEPGRGLDLHLDGLTEGFERFSDFKSRLNKAARAPEDRRRVLQVARLFLAITEAIYRELEDAEAHRLARNNSA